MTPACGKQAGGLSGGEVQVQPRSIPHREGPRPCGAVDEQTTDPPAELEPPQAGDNFLPDLAARIAAEHAASGAALKRSLEHTINAGRLLIEAKALLKHGQWLPWLRECGVPERSARRYMHLAAYAADAKSANLADLAVAAAADPLELGKRHLDAPLCAADFFNGAPPRAKLVHQLGLPPIAAWCISVVDVTANNLPAWVLCPFDDLISAAEALAPVANAKADQPIKFDAASFGSAADMERAISHVQCTAMWLLGRILSEIEHRYEISAEQYAPEWDETHQLVMQRLEQQLPAEARRS